MFTARQLERYSRQFILREVGAAGQKRLLRSRVLVIGAGGLGSAALLYLAAAGVGTLGIADGDRVELSNLNRQILHSEERLGRGKAESARQTIQALNPDAAVRVYPERVTPDNILEILAEYEFILDCTDRFETKFLINDACVLAGKPYAHAGAVGFEGQAMTYVPGAGPCLRCILEKVPPREDAVTCSESGVLGTVPGILGAVQATEAVKYLLGAGELLTGRILRLDALTMRMRTVQAGAARKDCAVCGERRTILSLADNRAEYDPDFCC